MAGEGSFGNRVESRRRLKPKLGELMRAAMLNARAMASDMKAQIRDISQSHSLTASADIETSQQHLYGDIQEAAVAEHVDERKTFLAETRRVRERQRVRKKDPTVLLSERIFDAEKTIDMNVDALIDGIVMLPIEDPKKALLATLREFRVIEAANPELGARAYEFDDESVAGTLRELVQHGFNELETEHKRLIDTVNSLGSSGRNNLESINRALIQYERAVDVIRGHLFEVRGMISHQLRILWRENRSANVSQVPADRIAVRITVGRQSSLESVRARNAEYESLLQCFSRLDLAFNTMWRPIKDYKQVIKDATEAYGALDSAKDELKHAHIIREKPRALRRAARHAITKGSEPRKRAKTR